MSAKVYSIIPPTMLIIASAVLFSGLFITKRVAFDFCEEISSCGSASWDSYTTFVSFLITGSLLYAIGNSLQFYRSRRFVFLSMVGTVCVTMPLIGILNFPNLYYGHTPAEIHYYMAFISFAVMDVLVVLDIFYYRHRLHGVLIGLVALIATIMFALWLPLGHKFQWAGASIMFTVPGIQGVSAFLLHQTSNDKI